jgi:hypothetical protein
VNPDLFTVDPARGGIARALQRHRDAPATARRPNLYFTCTRRRVPGGEIRGDIAVVARTPSTYVLLATGLGALGLIAPPAAAA